MKTTIKQKIVTLYPDDNFYSPRDIIPERCCQVGVMISKINNPTIKMSEVADRLSDIIGSYSYHIIETFDEQDDKGPRILYTIYYQTPDSCTHKEIKPFIPQKGPHE